MSGKDVASTTNAHRKFSKEIITPHKIAVTVLIREFCHIKLKESPLPDLEVLNITTAVSEFDVRHKRDFAMLVLKLIQAPDLDLDELRKMMTSSRYTLLPFHLMRFENHLMELNRKGAECLVDTIRSVERFLMEPSSLNPCIHRSSVVGLFLRRVILFFDKLTFDQVASAYRSFKIYYKKAKLPPSYNLVEEEPSEVDQVNYIEGTPKKEYPTPPNMDMSDYAKYHGLGYLARNFETLDLSDVQTTRWTRRQAELFISRQAALLQSDELSALPPAELQSKLRELLRANTDYSEAHYLSFLNCLRVKEYCGAVDSLFHCFDRSTVEDKAFRYAALNLAVFHARFGHVNEALRSLKEAIMMAHEGNDNVCLQHALSWLYKLSDKNKDILMERSIAKCSEFNLCHLTSFGIQSLAQYAGNARGLPSLIFELMTRSDSLNYQHSMMDMMTYSYAQKAALWCMYGKTCMMSTFSQLLLHLNTASPAAGIQSYNSEAMCQAICNVANVLVEQGQYRFVELLLQYARDRFPYEPALSWWMLTEQLCAYNKEYLAGNWHNAEKAVSQIAVLNNLESQYRRAELALARGDIEEASEYCVTLMDACRDTFANSNNSYMFVRAAIILSECQSSATFQNNASSHPMFLLSSALSIALNAQLEYLAALVTMHIANFQLRIGLSQQALKLVESSLLTVLAHGGCYDRARAFLLLAKCKVAAAVYVDKDKRDEMIKEAIETLEDAKSIFVQVYSFTRIKDLVYLQALLYNEVGDIVQRKRCSFEFRHLEEEYPTKIFGQLINRF